MKILTKEYIMLLHEQLLSETGGMPGLRDEGLLESAITAPFVTIYDYSPYVTVQAKAARLAYGLVKNHPFFDGNKRIGMMAMLVFLHENQIDVSATQDELITLGRDLAADICSINDVISWIITHSQL